MVIHSPTVTAVQHTNDLAINIQQISIVSVGVVGGDKEELRPNITLQRSREELSCHCWDGFLSDCCNFHIRKATRFFFSGIGCKVSWEGRDSF